MLAGASNFQTVSPRASDLKLVGSVLIVYAHVADAPIDTCLFRCPGRPAIEITRYVDTHEGTGAVKLSSEARCVTVPGLNEKVGLTSLPIQSDSPKREALEGCT